MAVPRSLSEGAHFPSPEVHFACRCAALRVFLNFASALYSTFELRERFFFCVISVQLRSGTTQHLNICCCPQDRGGWREGPRHVRNNGKIQVFSTQNCGCFHFPPWNGSSLVVRVRGRQLGKSRTPWKTALLS